MFMIGPRLDHTDNLIIMLQPTKDLFEMSELGAVGIDFKLADRLDDHVGIVGVLKGVLVHEQQNLDEEDHTRGRVTQVIYYLGLAIGLFLEFIETGFEDRDVLKNSTETDSALQSWVIEMFAEIVDKLEFVGVDK
jgi:hypothetical protein